MLCSWVSGVTPCLKHPKPMTVENCRDFRPARQQGHKMFAQSPREECGLVRSPTVGSFGASPRQSTTPRKWWPSLVYRWLLVGNAFAVFFLTFWMKESRFRLYFRNLAYRSILLYFIYIHLFIRNATPNHCHENWNETYETNRLTVASFVARAAWRTELVCILHCAGRLEFHTSWSPQVSGSNLSLSLSPSPSGLPGNVSGNLTVCGKKMKWQIYIYILYI